MTVWEVWTFPPIREEGLCLGMPKTARDAEYQAAEVSGVNHSIVGVLKNGLLVGLYENGAQASVKAWREVIRRVTDKSVSLTEARAMEKRGRQEMPATDAGMPATSPAGSSNG